MYIIAGLGNPTSKYERTRHNIGFEAIDIIGKKYGIKTDTAKHKALCGTGIIGGEKVLLLKPQTYMNLSGEAVADALNYYKLDADNELIVIFDDISLPTGKLRIRRKGSAGGHNGVKSIIAMTGTDGFKRIKIGVGEKPEGFDLVSHVMGYFKKDDRRLVDDAMERAAAAVELIVNDQFDRAMNMYN